jgi:hypothetical protein
VRVAAFGTSSNHAISRRTLMATAVILGLLVLIRTCLGWSWVVEIEER